MQLLIAGITFVIGVVSLILYKFLRRYIIYELDHSEHYGGELVADVLRAHNVRFLFTLCGGHISPILVAAEKRKIRVIDVRHEASAVFAADAVSRLSGTVGVAAVTAGPGLTNTVTAVKNAQIAESPVVILAGAAAGILRGRGSLQDIDQLTLFSSICKWSTRVKFVKDIVPSLCKAFHKAASGTPGPVLVELPIDTLYPYNLVKKHMGIRENPRSLRQRFINWYMRLYLFHLFADGFRIKPCAPNETPSQIPVLKPTVPRPSSRNVALLAKLVSEAQRPVMLVGSQAVLPPIDANKTAKNVEIFGLPTMLSGMARGLLGRTHPLQFRHVRRVALAEADLIILAGTICDFRLDYGRLFNRSAKIVVINRDKAKMSLNSDIWLPYLSIQADVGTTLSEAAELLTSSYPCTSDQRCPSDWYEHLSDLETARFQEIKQSCMQESTGDGINPLKLLWLVEQHALPQDEQEAGVESDDGDTATSTNEDSIIIADGGDFVGSAAYILSPRSPLSWLDPGPFGTLGVGGGFALGAKLCRPEATVWVIYGDGSAGYSLAECDSQARHKAPAISLIGNDACWSQIARDQQKLLGSLVACNLAPLSYERIGAAYSGYKRACQYSGQLDDEPSGQSYETNLWESRGGFLIDQRSDAMAILTRARSLNQRGVPVTVNCIIAKSDFREGSSSV